jgi:hypothetical protein
MKNIIKLKAIRRIAGIIALVAVIGFPFAACDDGSTGGGGGGGGGRSDLIGNWNSGLHMYIRFTANNFRITGQFDDTHASGPYTVSGTTIRCTVTDVPYYWTNTSYNSLKVGDVVTLRIVEHITEHTYYTSSYITLIDDEHGYSFDRAW